MKVTNIFVFIIMSNILITGCGRSGGDDSTSSDNYRYNEIQLGKHLSVDLSKSNGLFLAPQGAVDSSSNRTSNNDSKSSNHNTIYSLNPDNTITEVSTLIYKDPKTGKTINHKHTEQIQPTSFYDTKNFILISYQGVYKDSKQCSIVPVRKSDGALFCLDISPNNSNDYFENIQSNSSGTIIVINHESGLSRLDLTDPNNPTVTQLTSSNNGEFIYTFSVNSDGDVLANIGTKGFETTTKLFKITGGFQLFSNEHNAKCFVNGGKGDESSFYFAKSSENESWKLELYKITKSNSNYLISNYSRSQISYNCLGRSIAKVKDKIYFIEFDGFLVEAVNPSRSPVNMKSNFSKISQIISDNNDLIILGSNHLGNSGIDKYNTTLNTFSQVLSPGEYTIVSLSVSKSGVITFMGRRASDNAKILGTISKDTNKLTIVNQSLNGDVSKIVSLN